MAKTGDARRIRVLVSAKSAVSRAGLESIVRGALSLQLAGSFSATSVLGTHARELRPDVVLAELDRSDLQHIRYPQPLALDTRASIVALIDNPDAHWIARALRNGVKAIIPRKAAATEILWAIQTVNSGLFLLDPDAAQQLTARFGSESLDMQAEFVEELTQREIEILRMLAEGVGNKQIASRLTISEHTVKFHISSILDKLGASSRTEAVTIGIRMGIVLL
ncbi:MAG: two component LuxR family transcriptional regulator [Acidobacteriaceae bacterium]|nr:two component LuxR family transcriptional regulator [Acidobacteriaceae bacterium]